MRTQGECNFCLATFLLQALIMFLTLWLFFLECGRERRQVVIFSVLCFYGNPVFAVAVLL